MGNQIASLVGGAIGTSIDPLMLIFALVIAIPCRAKPWLEALVITSLVAAAAYIGLGLYLRGSLMPHVILGSIIGGVLWGAIAVLIAKKIVAISAPK
ncbi:hypothetical protein [Labrys neptuniae]